MIRVVASMALRFLTCVRGPTTAADISLLFFFTSIRSRFDQVGNEMSGNAKYTFSLLVMKFYSCSS